MGGRRRRRIGRERLRRGLPRCAAPDSGGAARLKGLALAKADPRG